MRLPPGPATPAPVQLWRWLWRSRGLRMPANDSSSHRSSAGAAISMRSVDVTERAIAKFDGKPFLLAGALRDITLAVLVRVLFGHRGAIELDAFREGGRD